MRFLQIKVTFSLRTHQFLASSNWFSLQELIDSKDLFQGSGMLSINHANLSNQCHLPCAQRESRSISYSRVDCKEHAVAPEVQKLEETPEGRAHA
jgi:hypothetical protein